MPIEIREIVIKTEIFSSGKGPSAGIKEKELNTLKRALLDECKKMVAEQGKKNSYQR